MEGVMKGCWFLHNPVSRFPVSCAGWRNWGGILPSLGGIGLAVGDSSSGEDHE